MPSMRLQGRFKMDKHELARRIAEESIVLLKNEEHLLPLAKGSQVAFFGRTQMDTIFSGNGSGATATQDRRSILYACEEAGLKAVPSLKAWYEEQFAEEMRHPRPGIDWSNAWEMVHSGEMYEVFGRYIPPQEEYAIDDSLLDAACACTDTAVIVLGRNAGGEECDRHLAGDYLLTPEELALYTRICKRFRHVVLMVNSNGPIDLAWTEQMPAIQSILFIGIPGEKGAEAVANILTGQVNPSGKLAMTLARHYEDYPSAFNFSFDKDDIASLKTYESYGLQSPDTPYAVHPVTVYQENLLMGYRGFDALQIQPLYPFGFGLSYTGFSIRTVSAQKNAAGVELCVRVENIGQCAGREVVQVYMTPYGCLHDHAGINLVAYGKTRLLSPGEAQDMTLSVSWREISAFSEEAAAWIIEKGCYVLKVGDSSEKTEAAARIDVPESVCLEQCSHLLALSDDSQAHLHFASHIPAPLADAPACAWQFTLTQDDVGDVLRHSQQSTDIPAILHDMSVEELAALCVGYGPGIPFSAYGDGSVPGTIMGKDGKPLTCNTHTTGLEGYISPAMPEKKIWSMAYRDGPAGVGGMAWPTEMLLACSFDDELCYAFGNAVGQECEDFDVDVWLAPAVNLQRHPLCGRNFEYFSEDPLLAGRCACAVTRGVQENHQVRVCPKHFAANEQETFRRGNSRKNYDAADSIVTERALREMYLRPFEMLVREANAQCIMTSFNKINGTFAAGSQDLCNRLLRDEWGFAGIVVTDWGDMDTVVDGADAVAAGNDIVMPGGPPVIAQILKGYQEGRVTREALELAVAHLLAVLPEKPHRKELD